MSLNSFCLYQKVNQGSCCTDAYPMFGRGRVLSEPFMQVPSATLYPDYYTVIQRPVSFQLVRVGASPGRLILLRAARRSHGNADRYSLHMSQQSRLKNRNYQTIEKFRDDVNLIFDNAQTYNEENSVIWQDAQDMKVSLPVRK